MDWMATHGLYTREEWEANAVAAWVMDIGGGVWFKGEVLPASATAVVEGIWS